jgi:hypothetical protein
VNGFKKKMKMLYELTQKAQDLETLEKSPFVVFLQLFQNSFNKNTVDVKDYNNAIMKKWEVICLTNNSKFFHKLELSILI